MDATELPTRKDGEEISDVMKNGICERCGREIHMAGIMTNEGLIICWPCHELLMLRKRRGY